MSRPAHRQEPEGTTGRKTRAGLVSTSLLVLAACGWLILVANLFGITDRRGWVFPVVEDVPGLAASTLLLAILGLTPPACRHLFLKKGRQPS